MCSPLRVEGIGLSDGEVMEHLCSYLKRYCGVTKEMLLAHHVDVLTHALLYYSITTCVCNTLYHDTMSYHVFEYSETYCSMMGEDM